MDVDEPLHCFACGTPAAAERCEECGATLDVRCPDCEQPVAAWFQYCAGCGLALGEGGRPRAVASSFHRLRKQMPAGLAEKVLASRGRIEGERKQVTVLFCDIVSSATIAEGMDPEDYRDLLDRYLEVVFEEVFRVEGIVNQIAGDGVMSLFGAPIAHEDAPERAVQAAYGIRDRVARLVSDGDALQLRIGIHTGPVIVGTVGNDLKMDYTAIGDTTNLAARLQSGARPGAIVVSEATRRLVADRFEFRSLGELRIRGKAEPTRAYELVGAAGSIGDEAIGGAFVGRSDAHDALGESLEAAAGGEARCALVLGEAGLGKSHLVREFLQRRRGAIGAAPVGRCFSYAREGAYGAFIDLLRSEVRARSTDDPEEVRERLGQWLEERSSRSALPAFVRLLGMGGEEDAEGDAFLEPVAEALAEAPGRGTAVIVLEDIQWMDEGGREVIRRLVATPRGRRVLVLCTARPGGPDPLPGVARDEVWLEPFSRAESEEMIGAVLGADPLPELVDLVVERADGNPFFTQEVTRELVDAGVVAESEGRLGLGVAGDRIDVPVTVQEILAARLDRLSPEDKRVLQVASVVGRRFSRKLLDAALDREELDSDAALGRLIAAGVLSRADDHGDDFVFEHSLAQEVAYEGLLNRHRRDLHGRIGQALESDHGAAPSEASAQLARHFGRAGESSRSFDHLLAAGHHAEGVPSYGTAAGYYRQAWELSDRESLDDGRRLEAGLSVLAMAALFGEGAETVADRVEPVVEELVAAGSADQRIRFRTFSGLLRIMGAAERLASGLEQLGMALQDATAPELQIWRGRIHRGLALGGAMDGRFQEAAAHADAAIALASEEADAGARLWGRSVRDAVLLHTDALPSCIASAEETWELATERGYRSIQVAAASHLATATLLQGQLDVAVQWARRGLDVAASSDTRAAMVNLLSVAVLADDLRGAGEDATQADRIRAIETHLQSAAGVQQSLRFVVDAVLLVAEPSRAGRVAQTFRRRAGGRLRQAQSALALARVARHGDDAARAGYFLEEAVRVSREIDARSVLASALVEQAALTAHGGGGADEAARLLEQARGLAAEIGMRYGIPPA